MADGSAAAAFEPLPPPNQARFCIKAIGRSLDFGLENLRALNRAAAPEGGDLLPEWSDIEDLIADLEAVRDDVVNLMSAFCARHPDADARVVAAFEFEMRRR